MYLKQFQKEGFYQKVNGEDLEFSNQEDGFIMKFIDLSHIFSFSEDLWELILILV